MKTFNRLLFSFSLSIFFILLSFGTRASENLDVEIIENSNIIRMEVKIPSSEEMNIYLVNERDREIFNKRVEFGETLESQFDFTDLKNGTYKLVSEVGNIRLNRVIEVSSSEVEFVDSNYSFVPAFDQKGDKLTVHYINDGGSDIGISIENERGLVFDTFYNNGDLVFSKSFSILNLESGQYKFKLTSKGNFYTHEFEVD